MKILVTGALGHIGSALIRKLPDIFEDLSIVMVDDLSTQRYCSLFNLPEQVSYTFIESKIQQLDLEKILTDVDVVVHLAATTDATGTVHTPELVYENNFSATQLIAQACLKYNVPLIFPSTTSVYGSQSALVDEECTELCPQSPYAACKIKEETLLRELATQGLQVTICRLGTIYGTSEGMRFHTAVNKFCWQAVMDQPLTVWETALDQKRPYLFLDDAVSAIGWIIKNKLFSGQTYNVVTGNHTVRDILTVIREDIENVQVTYVQHAIMNQLSYEVSPEKLRKTGFEFGGPLQKGIGQTVKLLKNAHKRGVV